MSDKQKISASKLFQAVQDFASTTRLKWDPPTWDKARIQFEKDLKELGLDVEVEWE